ncbi:hypothetical protein LZ32DRAFT_647249, partial [Colletotrichum eremochloae]
MPPRAKKSDIKDEDWEKFQPIIRRLYLTEDKSLKDLLTILSMSHGFRPSKAQLEWKLTQWRMTKKMIASEWKYVHHRIRNRRAVGKESSVYLSGVQLRDVTIEKAKVRHCYETALEKSMGVVVPPSPTDLSLIIRTPSPQRDPELDNMNEIPWLTARNLIQDFNVSLSGRVGKHFQFPDDKILMLAMKRPIVQANHTARLQSTFEALSLIMPEQLQQDHVYHAESLLLSSKHGSNITGALQMMLFLLSNNFLDRMEGLRNEHDKVIGVLLDVLPQIDGWVVLMSQQYTELPVSIQSALDRLFKEAILGSRLDLVRSLIRVGVDAKQTLTSVLQQYDVERAVTAFEYAIFMKNCPLVQLLIELGANHPSSNLELIRSAWEYRNTLHTTLESMTTLLSNFVFLQKDDKEACKLLDWIDFVGPDSIAEPIFEFFRTKLRTRASRSQLLTSVIRARSRIALDLLSENRGHVGAYVNHTMKMGATPIMAAIEVRDTKLLGRLVQLGASLDPPRAIFPFFSLLQYAAYLSDAEMLQKMLWHGAKIDYCRPSSSTWPSINLVVNGIKYPYIGETALQSALLGGKVDNAIFLLEAGAKLVGSELAIAIASSLEAVVDKLLTKGASFAETSTISDTLSVLEAAVLAENIALISRTINTSSQDVVAYSLWAAIFVAKCTSDLSIFKFLLGNISVTSKSEDLWIGTAMHLAAKLGVLEIVELMLASGLRPEKCLVTSPDISTYDLRNQHLRVLYDYVVWRKDISIIHTQYYEEHDLVESALSRTNGTSEIGFLILLRQHGYHRILRCPSFIAFPSLQHLQNLHSFDVEMTSRILSDSIRDRCYDVTEWLLALGVDVNLTSEDPGKGSDITPVQAAAQAGNIPLVERLMKLGADIHAPAGRHNATALQHASMRGYFGL